MTPLISQKVLVLVDPEQNGGVDTAPARIIRVWPDETINVSVIPNKLGPQYQLDKVRLYRNREDALAGHSAGVLSAYPVRSLFDEPIKAEAGSS